ncbi:MAG: DsbA family protein [Candidatus Sedimenticola sp. (ex Thyasira tokunagai)]
MKEAMQKILYYVHDPMCSWCWAFRPIWLELVRSLPATVTPRRLLGGLAVDSDEPMPKTMQSYLQKTWRTIEQQVPGAVFNFDFWELCQPRRSTWPACRGVIAAREQGLAFEEPMIEAIQHGYYLHARNPSDSGTLMAMAQEIGLDGDRFAEQLQSAATRRRLEREMAQGRAMGVSGFPSLVLQEGAGFTRIEHNYLDAQKILRQL